MDADVIIIGAGLAGLVASNELVRAGRRVAIVEQENARNLGGQAFWSFGGIFLVDTPMQRRLGVKDSFDLAWQDWQGSAAWDRLDGDLPEDEWAARWGRAYVEFAAGEKRPWLQEQGVRFTPLVGWAERGSGTAAGHGNSVPRFHVPWGTGTGISEPFADKARAAAEAGSVTFHFRHRVDGLIFDGDAVVGVHGSVLAPDDAARGVASNRDRVADFEGRAQAVVIASGGIGGNHERVREWWPQRLGTPPSSMITGVPQHVDGRMLDIAAEAGARLVNRDRMWHYTEGVQNWDPVWPQHGIRILPGPSSMWFDALGRRLPVPGLPGYDTLGTLKLLRTTPDIAQYDHSWFILTQKMIEKEFALSGSEQNPDLTDRDLGLLVRSRLGRGAPPPVEAFKRNGADFVVAASLGELVAGMNALTDTPLLDVGTIERQIRQRDAELDNPYSKDTQVLGIHNSRRFLGDRLTRTARPHKILDPRAGPLIAVRLHVITRKSLGGIQTDLSGKVFGAGGRPIPGLYAAGEAAGFGGGGAHGYNALEGTFLGGCIFSGRAVGRSIADLL
ncbi:FAD-binding dehydrogenase [Arthrobacter agilis]|uniref:FAD-binding dehydrogenase n=1 Tax=Arthrobacter agilis TaxID=37921 RepID=UPI000B363E7B|nr:FAD-binding dehydrogenase [Arthrobacter agilis]OUM42324.1 FAD-binding dehydrogenase [Arthrobacter agilis]PPB45667.1 FAD-binding dehydrogenase [Arthrobacter agilis]TPV26351.1 FAD-binding dehydrogenase [Arthrobacter agilis]VDR30783.1 KsdD-like steroid dehydrogenase MSMEG_5835 [Arthrobacter agilis]